MSCEYPVQGLCVHPPLCGGGRGIGLKALTSMSLAPSICHAYAMPMPMPEHKPGPALVLTLTENRLARQGMAWHLTEYSAAQT